MRQDPLNFGDLEDAAEHGDPGKWTYIGPNRGSPTIATAPTARRSTMKHYDRYQNEFGDEFELHDFRNLDDYCKHRTMTFEESMLAARGFRIDVLFPAGAEA